MELHLLGWLADLLGAHGLGPWPESFQARHPCRDCWWHTSCWCATLAPGSAEANSKRPHADGCRNRICRTKEELVRDMAIIGGPFRTIKARTDAQRDLGVSKAHCVLSHLPGSQPTTDASADVAHLFMLGLTRHEAFWMLDDLIPSCFSWDDLNAAAKALDLPKGHRCITTTFLAATLPATAISAVPAVPVVSHTFNH